MTVNGIKATMSAHCVEWLEQDGELFVLEIWVREGKAHAEWICTSGWSLKQVRSWLGY